MCGLFAFYSEEKVIADIQVEKALSSMLHRGPDQKNIWFDKNHRIALAHTRLSINDLTQVPYPLSSQNGAVQMIFNGELYGYHELQKSLEKKGHQFKTRTDCEVALHLYQDRGINFLKELRGEFAFIIWDEETETLFAVRDRFGIKPLHFSIFEGGVYFASEIPTLFKAGVEAAWNKESFYEYLHFNLGPDRTLYKNIHQIPAGHYLKLNKQGLRICKYWDLDYPTGHNNETHDLKYYVEQVRNTLVESTKLRLEADVPVAYYLSGGLDSAALLGIGAQVSTKAQHAFSICFSNEKYSELTYAKESAASVGAHFHPLFVSEQDISDNFEAAAIHAMCPMGNAAAVSRFLLSKFVHQSGFKAVLSGEGADEVFFGYNFLRIEALEDDSYRARIQNVEDFVQKMNDQFPVDRKNLKSMPFGFDNLMKGIGYVPRWIQTQAFMFASHRGLLSSEFQSELNSYNPYKSLLNSLDIENQVLGREPVLRSLYFWIKCFFPNNMLSWVGDRMEMAHSIESRQPYLDHHLFEITKNIPTHFKISGTTEKYVLREAVKPFITETMYKKEKYIFQAPPLTVSKDNSLRRLCIDLIMNHLPDCELYDKKSVINYIDSIRTIDPNDRAKLIDSSSTLMSLASIAALQKNYNPGC